MDTAASFQVQSDYKSPQILLLVAASQMMDGDSTSAITITAVIHRDPMHTHAKKQQPVMQPEQLGMLDKHRGKGGFKEWESARLEISCHISNQPHTT